VCPSTGAAVASSCCAERRVSRDSPAYGAGSRAASTVPGVVQRDTSLAPVRYAPRNPDTACPSGEVTSTLEPYPPAASSPGTGPLTGVGIISAVTTSPETVTGTWKYRRAVTWRASVTVAATATDQTPAAISSIPATAGSATTNGSRAREAVGTPGTRAASSPASSRVATSHAVT